MSHPAEASQPEKDPLAAKLGRWISTEIGHALKDKPDFKPWLDIAKTTEAVPAGLVAIRFKNDFPELMGYEKLMEKRAALSLPAKLLLGRYDRFVDILAASSFNATDRAFLNTQSSSILNGISYMLQNLEARMEAFLATIDGDTPEKRKGRMAYAASDLQQPVTEQVLGEARSGLGKALDKIKVYRALFDEMRTSYQQIVLEQSVSAAR